MSLQWRSRGIFRIKISSFQNDIILGAMKVTPNQNIKPIDPLKRNCYFDYEYPPASPLKAHEKYSQTACFLECRLEHALANMTVDNKCIPWYYPQLDPDTRMCSPFEAKE